MRTRYTHTDYDRENRNEYAPIRLKQGEAYFPVDGRQSILKNIVSQVGQSNEVNPIRANLKRLPLNDCSVDEVHASGIGGMMQVLYENTSEDERHEWFKPSYDKIRHDGSKMLSEAQRVLKPGGSLFLQATILGNASNRKRDAEQIQKNIALFGFKPEKQAKEVYLEKGVSASTAIKEFAKEVKTGKLRTIRCYVRNWWRDYRKPRAQVVLEFKKA